MCVVTRDASLSNYTSPASTPSPKRPARVSCHIGASVLSARNDPDPVCWSPPDRIRRRPAQVPHPIQHITREDRLRPLPCCTPRAKAISDDRLVPEEDVLHARLPIVGRAPLRGGASHEAEGRRGARGGGAGRVGSPATRRRLCVLRQIGDQLVAGLEQLATGVIVSIFGTIYQAIDLDTTPRLPPDEALALIAQQADTGPATDQPPSVMAA